MESNRTTRGAAAPKDKSNLTMKRQSIGPIIISLILCGLLADHLFFYQSPWSVAGFLSKVLSIFGAIFAPAFNPVLYGWLDEITVPIVIIALIVVLLFLTVARTKLAMSKVTPNADAALARLARGGPTSPKAAAAPVQASVAPSKLRQYGLMRKLALLFGSVGVLFGAIVCITVYSFLCRAIEKEVKSRADVMAMHISEMAARQITSGDIQELGVQVDKYAAIRAVAYVYVEDEEGKIIANTPGDLPRHLNRDFPKSAEQALSGTDVQYRGLGVYEIAKQIAGGKAGFVHFGIWHAEIKEAARLAVTPIAGSIFAIVLGALGIFVWVTWQVNRPFFELVEHAERISKGDFAVTLRLKRSDEIGEIARSVERMRSSLRAVATRLEKRR